MKRFLTQIGVIKTVLLIFATPCLADPSILAALDLQDARTIAQPFPFATIEKTVETMLDTESTCLAAALYHEARGETITGRLAVARVILNRERSAAYPDTICGVVYQGAEKPFRCQFSFACDGKPDLPREKRSFRKAMTLAHAILKKHLTDCLKAVDPREFRDGNFDQITHYHTASVNPSWSSKLDRIGEIGNHIFYRSARVARTL